MIDTGIGFNRDQHALLFAEFSRLEQGARMAHGLGLGLSIVERLVAAMGLTLELASIEGKGSRFSLYLPPGKITPNARQPSERSGDIASLAGLRILCVDNERAVLDAMEGLLTGWGCDVRSARSLKDIDKDGILVGWLPDLVLMDYHLDQTSGLDAVEWLRHNVGGHLPAALVTADRTAAVRALAEERGIAVVTKPVKPAALRARRSAADSPHAHGAARHRRPLCRNQGAGGRLHPDRGGRSHEAIRIAGGIPLASIGSAAADHGFHDGPQIGGRFRRHLSRRGGWKAGATLIRLLGGSILPRRRCTMRGRGARPVAA